MNRKPLQIMYILQNGDTNQYKIGITNDLNRRLSELQIGCPNEIKVIKLYTHYQRKIIEKYERVLHNYYTKVGCRIRPNGEWYELHKPDINYLCKPNSIAEQNELVNELCKMI